MRPLTLAILILAGTLPASAATVIRVTASYPGASAVIVEETVLAPIVQQINGVEGLTRIETEARHDGTATILVYFKSKVDVHVAQVLVQNRVSLAMPLLPDACQQRGITSERIPAGPPQFWLALTSTDDGHYEEFLNNYAIVNLKDEYNRLPGVSNVRVIGGEDYSMQVLLDPNKLAARKLMGSDVVNSLRQQNSPAAGGANGGDQSPKADSTSGSLKTPAEFEALILRTSPDGQIVRLKDVARVELSAPKTGFARVDGRPAALIEVSTWPKQVTARQLLVDNVVNNLPPGMKLVTLANRATNRLISVEVRSPAGSTLEQTAKIVAKSTERIHELPEKPTVFAFSEDREPNLATIFVKANSKESPTTADIEKVLSEISGASIRVGGVPPREVAFPVRIALIQPPEFSQPVEQTEKEFREAAERVLATLAKDEVVAAPAIFPQSTVPLRTIDVDKEVCAKLRVDLNDLLTTLQTSLGSTVHATNVIRFGKTIRVNVQTDPKLATEDLTKLLARNKSDEMVPFDKLVKVRESNAPTSILGVDGHRSIVITAAPASGKTSAQVAAKCLELAQKALPKGYRAIDLTDR